MMCHNTAGVFMQQIPHHSEQKSHYSKSTSVPRLYMSDTVPTLLGWLSKQVRRTITEFLEKAGLFRGTADNKMSLGICSRSKDVIEPLMRPQWWVNCKQMAAEACAAVRNGDLQILPVESEATWFRCAQVARWSVGGGEESSGVEQILT